MGLELGRSSDFDAMERALNVRRRARLDGQSERPQTASPEESAVERDIRLAIMREHDRIDGERDAVIAACRRDMQTGPVASAGAGIADAAKLSMRLEESRLSPPIQSAWTHCQRMRESFRAFQQTHGLNDIPPRYPQSLTLAIGLLLAAAVLEAAFSATLFVKDANGGYVEAASVALGLGAANVLLGVLAGYIGLRYWRARHLGFKTLGLVALAVFAALALGLNLFAARYRESLAQGHDQAGPLATLSRGDLFGLMSPEAVVLLMIGLGVWIFSVTKGYSGLDEPYPDYGKLDRQRQKAEDAFADLRDDAIDTLTAPIEEANAAIEAGLASERARLERARRAFDKAGAAAQAAAAAKRRLDAAEIALIEAYRRENAAARTTPPPAYFAQPVRTGAAEADALAAIGDDMARLDAAYRAAVQQAAAARLELQALHEASQARLFGVAA